MNSKFYRRMRKEQQEGQKIRAEISKILKADFEKTMPKEMRAVMNFDAANHRLEKKCMRS